MFRIAKITFKSKVEKINFNVLFFFLLNLYESGQILKEYTVESFKNIDANEVYVATVTITGDNAFNNNYLSKYLKDLMEYYDISFEILSPNKIMDQTCRCHNPKFYVLNTNNLDTSGPILCGDCFGVIPLYDVPFIDGDSHYHLLEFVEQYKSLERLRISREYYDFADDEIRNVNSKINQLGYKLAKDLSKIITKDVYYMLRNPFKSKDGRLYFDEIDICPMCNKKLKNLNSENKIMDYHMKKCDDCKIFIYSDIEIND